jgi:rfaE bifunctional protein nucleotidyltransferase chain/domain
MNAYQDKIYTLHDLLSVISELKNQHKKIVFTNGCFDILHLGHVQYLEKAKAMGDVLIIGVNSDHSVQQLKGPNRPIQTIHSRMGILAGLQSTDAIIAFDEETPLQLIELIQPDVLVKGGDWSINQIVGAEFVQKYGGMVKNIDFLDGHSTTNIVDLILKKQDL